MIDISDHNLGFLKYLFGKSYNGERLKPISYKRDELIREYLEFSGSVENFTEALDELIVNRMIAMKSSNSGFLTEYSLGRSAVDHLANLSLIEKIDSSVWIGQTYRLKIDETHRKIVLDRLKDLNSVLEEADLSQEQKSQAGAMIASTLIMAEAPDPPWEIIKEILYIVAAIAASLSLALHIAEMIK